MDLKDFVKSVVVDIVNGIKEANNALKDSDAIVNPSNVLPFNDSGNLYGHILSEKIKSRERPVHKIDFDVAVTASEGKETKGGIAIAIASIGIGTSGKSDTTQSTTSRIKFSIPIAFPESDGK